MFELRMDCLCLESLCLRHQKSRSLEKSCLLVTKANFAIEEDAINSWLSDTVSTLSDLTTIWRKAVDFDNVAIFKTNNITRH